MMAATRIFAEIVSGADIVAVIRQRVKESGLTLETIIGKANVSPDEWANIVALAADPRITQLRDVARAAGVELVAIESPTHAPWLDRHSPTHHAKRSPGLYDHHLS
jgi:predicted transcriptional regulator